MKNPVLVLLLIQCLICYSYNRNHGFVSRRLFKLESKNKKNIEETSSTSTTAWRDGVTLKEEERLAKVISRAGIASRRAAEKLIEEGKVTVNGKPPIKGKGVNARHDVIMVNGEKIRVVEADDKYWIIVHKPRNVLTTMNDDRNRDTIVDLVPQAKQLRLLPVGRLERSTAGLMIMTNDNGWLHPLTHPSFEHKCKYQVIVQGIPDVNKVEQINDYNNKNNNNKDHDQNDSDTSKMNRGGIVFNGERIKSINIDIIEVNTKDNLTLTEVTCTQSRSGLMQYLAELLGCVLVSVRRTEFGPLRLKGLRRGSWRELTAAEIGALKRSCKEVENKNRKG